MANGDVIIKILGDDTDLNKKLKGVGGMASTAMKAVAAGAAAAGAAVAALGKSALDAYASYEQLAGGVQTLFGESAAATVSKYAAEAYKTAGMSANAYMETVTSVSASLMQSLGGDAEAAAHSANEAIAAMADNASKMGTSMDTIVQTYQSLARGNYAMLDNLRLGYGGTKAELERLLADAEAYKASMGESVDYDISNFADITEAIDAIQEKMGLAGSAAEEASTTIEGSVNAMKAAWQNMLVGIADENADFEGLLGNLLSSVGTAAENILPRVKVILEGIGRLAVELAPTLVTTAVELLTSLGQYLSDNAPALLQRVPELIAFLASAIGENAPKLVPVAADLIIALATGLIEAVPTLVSKAPEIVGSLADGVSGMVDNMVQAGIDLIDGLAVGIKNAIPNLLKSAGGVCSDLLNSIERFFGIASPSKVMNEKVGAMLVAGVAQGIKEKKSEAVKAAEQMSKELLTAAEQYVEDKKFYNEMTLQEEQEFWEEMKTLNEFSADELAKIDKKIYSAKEAILKEEKRLMEEHEAEVKKREQEIQSSADRISGFAGLFSNVESEDVSGKDLVANLESQMDAIERFRDNLAGLQEKGVSGGLLEELAGMGPDAADEIEALNELTAAQLDKYIAMYEEKQKTAEEIAKKFYGVGAEEVEEFRELGTENILAGVKAQDETLDEATREVMEKMIQTASEFEKDFAKVGKQMMEGLAEGIIKNKWTVINSIVQIIRESLKTVRGMLGIASPSKVMAEIGKFMAQGLNVGWTKQMGTVSADIGESLVSNMESRMVNAYERMKNVMNEGINRLTGDVSVQAKGASNYTTNHNTTREGDFIVQIEKIVNDGKGTVAGMMEEIEFIRRQEALAKGGV